MKKVKFVPSTEEAELCVPEPKPSKNYIPQWYKSIPPSTLDYQNNIVYTVKKCTPFLDGFTSGYIQELWCDLRITKINTEHGNDFVRYDWSGKIRPVENREEPNMLPTFSGYYNTNMHWVTQWEPKTPKGYSTLYSHPSSRIDLPFFTLTGVIDTDKYWNPGPLPFFIKKDFEGIIPAGTPIYQINFIKREKWKSSKEKVNLKEAFSMLQNVKKNFTDGYKKNYWEKKIYE
jgi:hypothetical protein